jgi:hypothetical protein
MLQVALIGAAVAFVLLAVWYSCFLRLNRLRGLRVLRWLERVVAAHGQLGEVTWTSPARFRAELKLSGQEFLQPSLEVCLAPRHAPLQWALWNWRGRLETFTFQSNLLCPPGQSLRIGRSRWTGFARRGAKGLRNWPTYSISTLYLSTQPTWEPRISDHMNGALSIRDFEFLAVSFRPREPHFSVAFSLEDALRNPSGELTIFDNLRVLAEGSPTSRM